MHLRVGQISQTHDIQSVICSSASSQLKYLIAIAPSTVVMCIDASPGLVDAVFDGALPAQYRDGFTLSTLLQCVGQVPFDTLAELCNLQDSLVEISDAFEIVDADMAEIPAFDQTVATAAATAVTPPTAKRSFFGTIISSISSKSKANVVVPAAARSTSPFNPSSAASKHASHRQLVFAGAGLAGCLAQLACLEALSRFEQQRVPIKTSAVTFGAPSCFTSSVTFKVSRGANAFDFVNVCSTGDATVPLLSAAIEAVLAHACNGVATGEMETFLAVARQISKSQVLTATQMSTLDAQTYVLTQLEAFKQQHGEYELFPLGMHGFTTDKNTPYSFTDHEDEIRGRLLSIPWRR